MPERVYKRLDGASVPLETAVEKSGPLSTEDTSSKKSRKRKREHADSSSLREHAIALEPLRGSPPVDKNDRSVSHFTGDHDQRQQSKDSDGFQTATLTKPRSESRSKEPIRRSNERNSLRDRAKFLEPSRKSLPIWSHATAIYEALREKDALLLVGETGSGKSTQVPQMLVDEPWCKPQVVSVDASTQNLTVDGLTPSRSVTVPTDRSPRTVTVGGCIAITEPRRVAAITLARRVAEEIGSPLGSSSPASKVGYSVRFDNSTSPSTRVKFLTEGMLLQEMLRDPWLKAYSAVVVDEVHERGVNVDLVLGFLRGMIAGKNEGRGGVSLKVHYVPEIISSRSSICSES